MWAEVPCGLLMSSDSSFRIIPFLNVYNVTEKECVRSTITARLAVRRGLCVKHVRSLEYLEFRNLKIEGEDMRKFLGSTWPSHPVLWWAISNNSEIYRAW